MAEQSLHIFLSQINISCQHFDRVKCFFKNDRISGDNVVADGKVFINILIPIQPYIHSPRKYDPDIRKQVADGELVLQKAKEKCHISPIFTQLTAIVRARVDVSGGSAARGRTCKYLASVQARVLAAA